LPETEKVFNDVANERNAVLSIAQMSGRRSIGIGRNHELIVEVAQKHKTDHQLYHLDLPGIYQTKIL
jgi:dihydrofolate synthase/folylpolyglutamate synthase